MDQKTTRADLHVHSKYSTRPSQWILQKIGCPESFTEPARIYATARSRGMNLVTISDHNTILGALEIAHLDGAFVSEEITTYFPEDRCKLHVLAYDITEAHHDDFQKVRDNVFELVPYLREQKIVHVLAHPLFAVNDRLTPEHFEQALLLFNTFEFNGTRDETQNKVLGEIVRNLTREDMERLANKHDLEPYGEKPWKKGFTGGSDDHSALNIARVYTEADCDGSKDSLLQAVAAGQGRASGVPATPATMAHNLYGIAYQFYKAKIQPRSSLAKHLCFRFADNALDFGRDEQAGIFDQIRRLIGRSKTAYKCMFGSGTSAQEIMLREATEIIQKDEQFLRLAQQGAKDVLEIEREWSRFVGQATNRIITRFADNIVNNVVKGKFFDVFHSIGSAGSFYVLLAPYFVGFDLFSRERRFSDICLKQFGKQPHHPRKTGLKVGHFTDTYNEVNGVARTIRQQVDLVCRHNKKMTVITCGGKRELGVADFAPVGSFELPEYPELTLNYPPFLDMLAYCFDQDFDFILGATPGPVGLAALAISRILKLPFHGTYHTAIPQYVGTLTGDFFLEEAAWKYIIWFYSQMDVIYAPSKATKKELVSKGLSPDKIKVYPRGVDTSRFHPSKRNGFFDGLQMGDRTKLLYVGRVSKEKDLHILVEAFAKLCNIRPELQLVVVGDGPYLEEMKEALKGKPAVFAGVLEGDDLAQAYASADLFVFPSATDTFGNVVLEAQASGLPVVVADQGGPKENMIQDKTGLIAASGDPDSFVRAILHLTDYPERMSYMRDSARKYMEDRTFDATFLKTWQIFGESVRGDQ